MSSRKYRNSPIVEAVCEFRFKPGSEPWDLAVPGLVYEQIREDFPKRRQIPGLEVELKLTEEGATQQVAQSERIRFLSEDEQVFIQTGPDILSVNHLKPYSSWNKFSPLIQRGVHAYTKVANPAGIKRIGVRYINRIEVPGSEVDIDKYFEFRPYVGPGLPQRIGPFIIGVEIVYEEQRDVLRLQLSSLAEQKPGISAFVLDLDYFLAQPGRVALSNVFEWVDVAHQRVEEVFEASITDHLRQVFEEIA